MKIINWKILAKVSKNNAFEFLTTFIAGTIIIILYVGPFIISLITGNWWFLLLYIVSAYIDLTALDYQAEVNKDNENINQRDC